MWAFIFLFMIVAFIAATIYLITRVRKFAWVDRLAGILLREKNKSAEEDDCDEVGDSDYCSGLPASLYSGLLSA